LKCVPIDEPEGWTPATELESERQRKQNPW
jgi:hypothetical protein